MAGSPPVYNFQYNYDDYLKNARNQLNPQYDQQVANQQATVPLIQQQYANLAKSLQDQQTQREGQLNTQTQGQIGANRMKNAIMGLGDSTEDTSQAKNYADQNNQNINSLRTSLSDTLSQNNTDESQKILTVKQMVDAINNERNNAINGLASSLLGQNKDIYDKQFDTQNSNYWNQVNADNAAQQLQLQRQSALADQQYRQSQLSQQSLQAALAAKKDQQVSTNAAYNAVFFDPNTGKAKDQNAIYRDLMANGNLYRSQGVDVDSLWNSWRNLAYGSKYGYNKSQADYNMAANGGYDKLANNPKF